MSNWISVMKSDKQRHLESQGCQFSMLEQEPLDNHEIDLDLECYCGRPNIEPPKGE